MTIRRTLITAALVLAFGGTALAFPGEPEPCPPDAKKEFALLPYARTSVSPCFCHTFITCMNLDKITRKVTVQFHSVGIQQGSDATADIPPAGTRTFGTSTDPLGIRIGPSTSAGITGPIRLTGRVCSATKKLACDAALSCHCDEAPIFGAFVEPLTLIIRKQRGD